MPTEQCHDKKLEEFLAEYRRRGCTPADLPDAVRRQIFWIIKRHTSYTAWARAFAAFDALIRKMESLLPELAAKPFGTYGIGLPPDTKPFTVWPGWEYKLRWRCKYRTALDRLRKGDKGALGTAPLEPVLGWQDWPCEALLCFFRGMHPRDGYYRDFDPVIPEKTALTRLAWQAYALTWENITLTTVRYQRVEIRQEYSPESRTLTVVLPQKCDTANFSFRGESTDMLSRYPIPADLPPVPDPVILPNRNAPRWAPAGQRGGPLVYQSGEQVSLAGIYLSDPHDAIQYLHVAAPAPFLDLGYIKERYLPCTWTLIWRDDRYENGADIPEEEALYFPED